jgi:hypothetical protein
VGYIGVGNGVRIGGGGLNGERNYINDRYDTDSAIALRLHVEYGGFLVEKAFIRYNVNYLLGGCIGGGTMTVGTRFNRTVGTAAPGQGIREFNSVTANFFLAELHGGVTYSVLPWLHVGADASLPVFYSTDGFQGYTGMFTTINPAFRARLVFGNLG